MRFANSFQSSSDREKAMNKEKTKEIWYKILPFTFLYRLKMGLLKIIVAIITKSIRASYIFGI